MLLLSDLPRWFAISTVVALGLCFGSFLNVVIYRLPRGLNLAFPPSSCPACHAPIAARDNVPVFGWLLLRGKARCCGARIDVRYPLIELVGGLMAWAVLWARLEPVASSLGLGMALAWFATWFALGLGLVALSFIDLEFMILPDSLTLGGTVLGLASSFYRSGQGWLESLVGAAFGFVLVWLPFIFGYRKLRGIDGMGLGDAKLVMLAGAWFGVFGALFALFAGAIQGSLAALFTLLVQGKISEPAAVTEERRQLHEDISLAEGEQRTELERILAEDSVLAHAPGEGLGGARIAFGPFLALSCLELLFFEDGLRELVSQVVMGGGPW